MNKTEIENAIKNGESVWVVDEPNNIEKVKPISIEKSANRDVLYLKYKYYTSKYYDTDEFYYGDFEYFYKTKVEAEHYLHHANVERVEKLPFLTWEEFLEKKEISFKDYQDYNVYLYFTNNNKNITLFCVNPEHKDQYFDATEQNFYKAYDECVKLFKGE